MPLHKDQQVFKTNRYNHVLERTITHDYRNPKNIGKPRCCMSIYSQNAFGHVQCHAKGKVQDEEGYWWCGNHSAEHFDKKNAKRKAYWDKVDADRNARWNRSTAISNANKALLQAMRDIAAGHNDARQLATEVIKAYDEAHAMPMEGDTST